MVFCNSCTNWHFCQQCSEGSLFSTPSPRLICCLFDNSHSDKWKIIPHCGSDLHFPGDEWCWASFQMSLDHLPVFFAKWLFRSSAYFLSGLFGFIFCLCWVFFTVHGCSLVAVSGGPSLVVTCGLNCPITYGIFPNQGLNPCSLYWRVDS